MLRQTAWTALVGTALVFILSACGQPKTLTPNYYEPASLACANAVVPQQFVVRYQDGRVERIQAQNKTEFLAKVKTLPRVGEISYAEPDYRVRQLKDVNAQMIRETSANNWGVARIEAQSLWQAGHRGDGVIVAVIDSGLDVDHPQLRQQIAINAGEVVNGVDDDNNGFIDDVGGFDFVANKPLARDYGYHGTHVAGIVAAAHNDNTAKSNASYVQGVAPKAKILPLAFLDENGEGYTSTAVTAIKYAVARQARIINASWGGSQCSQALQDAVANLEEQNVLFVAASGNEGQNIDYSPMYPASFNLPSQITVGAVGIQDLRAEYSNFGRQNVHLFAPGSEIVSTIPGGAMGTATGTSMATPFVSGAAALLWSATPTATMQEIRQRLMGSILWGSHFINATQGRLKLDNATQ